VIKDKSNSLYGDKHPAWNYPGGEYSSDDGVKFIKMLKEIGYTEKENNTISFEMRPMDSLTSEESLIEFVKVFNKGME
jgi:hypothetical protein